MHSIVPIPVGGKMIFVVVLHSPTLENITANAPEVVDGMTLAGMLQNRRPLDVSGLDFVVAYEPNVQEFKEQLSSGGTPQDILAWLFRGNKLTPEQLAEMPGASGPIVEQVVEPEDKTEDSVEVGKLKLVVKPN